MIFFHCEATFVDNKCDLITKISNWVIYFLAKFLSTFWLSSDIVNFDHCSYKFVNSISVKTFQEESPKWFLSSIFFSSLILWILRTLLLTFSVVPSCESNWKATKEKREAKYNETKSCILSHKHETLFLLGNNKFWVASDAFAVHPTDTQNRVAM